MPDDGLPLVSICIPAHDDAGVVADALRSALRQEYSPLEILVLDNCSTDETWSIACDVAAGDQRVRILRHAENIGMARNFNACISEARGALVLILCSDDVLEAGCIDALARALHETPSAVLAACGRKLADRALRPLSLRRARRRAQEVAGARLTRECFAHGNRIGEPSAVLFRRSAALRGFNEEYNQVVDLEMWFHLLEQGSAVLLPEALCVIRQHGDQATKHNLRSGRIVVDKQRMFRRYAPRMQGDLSPLEKLNWDARMASSLARSAAAGSPIEGVPEELFYPRLFCWIVRPIVDLSWRLRNSLAA